MRDLIEACRAKFGPAPRSFSLWERLCLWVEAPRWLQRSPKDRMWEIYRNRSKLLRSGQVVWGALIQANRLLFSPGPTDSPAAAVYSLDPCFDGDPEALRRIAASIFALKGTTPDDPELRQAAEEITDEMRRFMNRPVPMSLTGGREIFFTSIMVHRRHLPYGYLVIGLFPLVVLPEETEATLILPARYWAPDLIEYWRFKRQRREPSGAGG